MIDKIVSREVYRKKLSNLLVYYKRVHIDSERLDKVQSDTVYRKVQNALSELPIGGILPDETRQLVAHCHRWHVIDTIPFTTPCCGTVLFEGI